MTTPSVRDDIRSIIRKTQMHLYKAMSPYGRAEAANAEFSGFRRNSVTIINPKRFNPDKPIGTTFVRIGRYGWFIHTARFREVFNHYFYDRLVDRLVQSYQEEQ